MDGKVLKANTDYTVAYRLDGSSGTLLDNKSIVEADKEVCVTVTGKGKYSGTLTVKYRVAKNKFQSLVITIDPQAYTGREIKLSKESIHVKVKKADQNELVMGTLFEIVEGSYSNNIKKGTASVRIRGLGDYGGEKIVKFKINTRDILFQ